MVTFFTQVNYQDNCLYCNKILDVNDYHTMVISGLCMHLCLFCYDTLPSGDLRHYGKIHCIHCSGLNSTALSYFRHSYWEHHIGSLGYKVFPISKSGLRELGYGD